MMAPLNKFVDKLITPNIENAAEKQLRWTFLNTRFSYIEKSKVQSGSSKKIEKVLSELNNSFKRFNAAKVDKDAYEKMETLMQLVQQKVQNYKSKHGKVYLFFSRVFFGNVDKVSRDLISHLRDLRQRHDPNAPADEPKIEIPKKNPFNFDDDEWIDFGDDEIEQNPFKKQPKRPQQKPIQEPVDFTQAPVYGPYRPPVADQAAQLENQIKDARLKFYEIFGEKVQITKDDDALLPLVKITNQTVIIDIPKALAANGFDAWFEQMLKDRQIQAEIRPLGKKLGNKEIPEPIDGIGCVKEFKLTLLEAQKLIKDMPEKGISSLSKMLVDERGLTIYHSQTAQIWGNEPNIEDTISLTLAHIEPKLDNDLGNVKANPFLQKNHPVPIVEFDDQGMIIKIPEDNVNLKNIIAQVFGFKQLFTSNGEPLEEVQFDRTYKIFRLNREEIENFLNQLGLDKIPPEGLHDNYANGNVTYLQYLIQSCRYHAYRPQREDGVLESISKSLSVLVPNEMQVEPLVSYHFRGWVSIKMSDLNLDYNRMLSSFLKTELFEIKQEFNGLSYVHEIIIHEEELPKFLKTLKLENNPNGTPYTDLLKEFKISLEVSYAESEDKQIDLPRTIARTLSILEPNLKTFFKINDFTPQSIPEFDFPFAQVNYLQDGLEIKIPKALNCNILIGPGKIRKLGEYLSQVFGLRGEIRNENGTEQFYCMKVPKDRIKSFLERDLSLRLLPSEYKKSNIVTFLNQYSHDVNRLYGLGERIPAHGSVADLSLHNPAVPVPEKIPEMADKEIIDAVNNILDKHPKKETYVQVFVDTFKRITPGKDNPDPDEFNKFQRTAEAIRPYLQVITHELLNNHELTDDRKREVLIEIALGCKETCLPGRLTKIQDVYQNLMQPELADKVRFILLDKAQQFKIAELASMFAKEAHNVHIVNLAKVVWGKEFGLSAEEGKLDEEIYASKGASQAVRAEKRQKREDFKLLYLNPENQFPAPVDKFRNACKKKLLDAVFESVRDEKDDNGLILNLDEYQDRLRKILREEGLKPGSKLNQDEPNQIEDEIARLIPKQEDLRKILLEKGKLAVLVRVHTDNGEMTEENIEKVKKQFLTDAEVDAEIKQIFSSNDDETYTITKETVKILLIRIGLLSDGTGFPIH